MSEETVWVSTRKGKKLEGLLRSPNGRGPFPAILFVPGLGMTLHEWNNSFDEISHRLVDYRFLTLQFSFDIFKSDGICRELPLKQRAHQLEDVLKWLFKRPDIDPRRVGILAQSFAVPTTLVARSDGIKSFLFVSGAYFPYQSISKAYTERGVAINREGDTSLPRSSGENTTVGKEFWQSLKSFDQEAAAKYVTGPAVFMVHGDKDNKIPKEDAVKVYKTIGSKNKKLKIFKGGDHGITDIPREMREEFLQEVVAWFQKTLRV